MNKSALDFTKPLGYLKNLVSQAPLFGEALAQKARTGGVTLRTVAGNRKETGDGVFARLMRAPNVNVLTDTQKVPKKPGVFVDFGGGNGTDALKIKKDFLGRRTPEMERLAKTMGDNKLVESKSFPSLLPETLRLDSFARSTKTSPRNAEALHQALSKRFGGKYIVKPIGGAASSADSIHSDMKGAEGLKSYMAGTPSRYLIAQPRLELEPLDRGGRIINNTAQLAWDGRLRELAGIVSPDAEKRQAAKGLWRGVAGGKTDYPMTYSLTGGKGKEYRVHVLNGKVIPYATSERGTLRGLIPWRTGNHAAAEQALQAQIDAMPKLERSRLQGTFGFDMMKGKDPGKWLAVESNPSQMSGGSGFISDHPAMQDSVAAAIQGRLPNYIKAQRGIQAGAALGGAGVITSALKAGVPLGTANTSKQASFPVLGKLLASGVGGSMSSALEMYRKFRLAEAASKLSVNPLLSRRQAIKDTGMAGVRLAMPGIERSVMGNGAAAVAKPFSPLVQMSLPEAGIRAALPTPVSRRNFLTSAVRGLLNPDIREGVGQAGSVAKGVMELPHAF